MKPDDMPTGTVVAQGFAGRQGAVLVLRQRAQNLRRQADTLDALADQAVVLTGDAEYALWEFVVRLP